MTAEGLVGHEGDRPAGQPANVQASAAVGRGVAHDDFRAAGDVVRACGAERQGAGLDRCRAGVGARGGEGELAGADLGQPAAATAILESGANGDVVGLPPKRETILPMASVAMALQS